MLLVEEQEYIRVPQIFHTQKTVSSFKKTINKKFVWRQFFCKAMDLIENYKWFYEIGDEMVKEPVMKRSCIERTDFIHWIERPVG